MHISHYDRWENGLYRATKFVTSYGNVSAYSDRNTRRFILPTGVPDDKVRGAIMGPTLGRQDPGGPHVGPMNLAIWGVFAQL